MELLFKRTLNKNTPKVLGLAKNYAKKGAPNAPKAPMVFTKPFTSLVFPGEKVVVPKDWAINHELELGFMISQKGRNIQKKDWKKFVGGYFLCLDLTEANLFKFYVKESFPWDMCKGCDGLLPVSKFLDTKLIKNPHNLGLKLVVNKKTLYEANTKDMYYDIASQIEFVSKYMTLNPGDLFLTGTASIGPLKFNDDIEGYLYQDKKELASIKTKLVSQK